jgi:hypothetical protein
MLLPVLQPFPATTSLTLDQLAWKLPGYVDAEGNVIVADPPVEYSE